MSDAAGFFTRTFDFFPINMAPGPAFLWFFPIFSVSVLGGSLWLMMLLERYLMERRWKLRNTPVEASLSDLSPYRSTFVLATKMGGLGIGKLPVLEDYPAIAYLFGGMRRVRDLLSRFQALMSPNESAASFDAKFSEAALRDRFECAGLLRSERERLIWRLVVGIGGFLVMGVAIARIARGIELFRPVAFLVVQLFVFAFVFFGEIWRLKDRESTAVAYATWLWNVTHSLRQDVASKRRDHPNDLALADSLGAGLESSQLDVQGEGHCPIMLKEGAMALIFAGLARKMGDSSSYGDTSFTGSGGGCGGGGCGGGGGGGCGG